MIMGFCILIFLFAFMLYLGANAMSAKDLKHMGREELLQLLIQITTEMDELKAQLAAKDEEIAKLRERPVVSETVTVHEPGSIAQAALQINHVFEDAQRAADQYLATIARMQREQAIRCQKLINDAQAEADRRLAEAQQRIQNMEAETARQCQELRLIAQQAATHNWDDLSRRLDQLFTSNTELHNLLSVDQKKRNWHR